MDTEAGDNIDDDKVDQANRIINDSQPDKKVTEEEFQNFMCRVTEIGRYRFNCNFK